MANGRNKFVGKWQKVLEKFGGKQQNHYLCTRKSLKYKEMDKTVFRRKIYDEMLNWKNEQRGEYTLSTRIYDDVFITKFGRMA